MQRARAARRPLSRSPSRQASARRLAEPLERHEPTIYFVSSMSDSFRDKVSFS